MSSNKRKSNIIPSPSASALKRGPSTQTTHQLGPENPRPFSVLSEHHVKEGIRLPYISDDDKYTFGAEYSRKMCELINNYLDFNTFDQLCYVGELKGSFAPLLKSEFCLLKPVVNVIPGHIHYEESPNHRMLPFRVANVGVEEFFREESGLEKQFDKVLLMDTVQYIDNQLQTYKNIFKTITDTGKLLIVHRAAPMCTLPFFTDIKDRMLQYDQSYLHIIQDLQASGLDVQWEIESLPVRMTKLKWMAMMKARFPSQVELVSNNEIESGLRELSEGVMKYAGDTLEFVDRLMFITAEKSYGKDLSQDDTSGTNLAEGGNTQRDVLSSMVGRKVVPVDPVRQGSLKYELEVTKDIDKLLREKEVRDKKEKEAKFTTYH